MLRSNTNKFKYILADLDFDLPNKVEKKRNKNRVSIQLQLRGVES